jgi:hypothetical protein
MKNNSINWHTGHQPENATHVIDDGGMIYWSITPDMTSDEVASAFRVGYDGTLGDYDVTDLRTGNRTDYSA